MDMKKGDRELTVIAKHKPDNTMYLVMAWADGEGGHPNSDGIGVEHFEFDLSCGAGLGSTIVQLSVQAYGQRRTETIDMAPVVREWIDEILRDMEQQHTDTNNAAVINRWLDTEETNHGQ